MKPYFYLISNSKTPIEGRFTSKHIAEDFQKEKEIKGVVLEDCISNPCEAAQKILWNVWQCRNTITAKECETLVMLAGLKDTPKDEIPDSFWLALSLSGEFRKWEARGEGMINMFINKDGKFTIHT